jgi:hypothetical protein
MKPFIHIRLYPQTQTVATNVYHYDSDGTLIEMTDTRHMVDHIYEIIFPIVEQYGNTHQITVHSMGKSLDIQQLEQSYYDYVDGVMNGDIE